MSRLQALLLGALVAIGLCAGAWVGVDEYGNDRYQDGHDDAIAARAKADADAVLTRAGENAATGAKQAADNTTITKEKDDEIADLRRRLAAAPRLRVGPSICPNRPAAPAEAQGTAGGDSPDSSPGLVSSRADADFKQLIEEVEKDEATARACQAFLEKNGMAP